MTSKQYLSQIERLDKKIQNKLSEEYQLKTLATNITVSNDMDRVQTSGDKDRIGSIVSKLIDVQKETANLVDEYIDQRGEIIHTIESLECLNYYEVLFKKYVEYKSLSDICAEMSYSMQHIKRIHGLALEEVKKIKGF